MPTAEGRLYGGRAADERRAERRRRLLDAAVVLFGDRGYAATTIEALYTEAKLAPRHFYEQFASREELLQAVYDETIERVVEALGEVQLTTFGDVRLRVRGILDAFARAMLSDTRRARIVYIEAPGASAALEEHTRTVVRSFAAMVEQEAKRGIRSGLMPDRDYSLTSLLLVGGTNAILLDWVSDEKRRPLEQVLDELTESFAAVLERPLR